MKRPSKFMDVTMLEHCTFDCEIFYTLKFITIPSSLLLISCKLWFEIVCFESVFPAYSNI
jgi:hypothetical protein